MLGEHGMQSWLTIIKKRWRWSLGIVLLIGYCAAGMGRLTYDVDVSSLLPQDLPETEGFRSFLRHFAQRGELILTLEAESREAADAASEAVAKQLLAEASKVKRVVWQREETDAAQWSELVAWSILNQLPNAFKAWETRLNADTFPALLTTKMEDLADSPTVMASKGGYDPLGLLDGMLGTGDMADGGSEFGSADGRFRVMYVDSVETLGDYRKANAWVEEMRSIAQRAAPTAIIRLTGDPAIKAEISRTMEADMKGSLGLTLVLIGLLVWLGYRSVRLLPLLALGLLLTFLLTLGTCGLFLGSLTMLTVGFGAILIGLSADYGVMLYQRSLEAGGDYREGARRARLGVFWAAATTAAVFLALIPLGFPGLTQLGLLVAGGVVIGAFVMLGLLPRALEKWGGKPRIIQETGWFGNARWDRLLAWVAGLILMLGVVGLFWHGLPKVDVRSGSLRPKRSETFSTMDLMRDRLTGSTGGLSVLITGASELETAEHLIGARQWLEAEKAAGRVQSFSLPVPFVNHPEHRRENLVVAGRILSQRERLHQSVMDTGFTEDAWNLASGVFDQWQQWFSTDHPENIRPSNSNNQWMLRRITSVRDGGKDCAALGFVTPTPGNASRQLSPGLPKDVFLAGPEVMNETLNRLLEKGFFGISLLFAFLTLALLAFALRSWRTLALVLLGITLSYASLLGSMSWFGLSWNFFTLPALLISLGTGSDYFIYVVLELTATPHVARMRQRIGRAIVVCVGNSVIGFASLLGANCTGLSNMGLVCALALTLNTLCALFVMPSLYLRWCKPRLETLQTPVES